MTVLRFILCLSLIAGVSFAQVFPGAIPTDRDLLVPVNAAATTLTQNVSASATVWPVRSGTVFRPGTLVSIDSEIVAVCSVSATSITICPGGRGMNDTQAASHTAPRAIEARWVSEYHLRLARYIKAITTALGANLVNVERIARRNAPNGYAGLDETGKVPASLLPPGGSNITNLNQIETRSYNDLQDKPVIPSAVTNLNQIATRSYTDLQDKPATMPPSVHNHAGTEINSGIVPPARLGSGSPDNTMVLYGDSVWRAAPEGGSGTGAWYATVAVPAGAPYVVSIPASTHGRGTNPGVQLTDATGRIQDTTWANVTRDLSTGDLTLTFDASYANAEVRVAVFGGAVTAGLPYTGATGDVDLGTHKLIVAEIKNTSPTPTAHTYLCGTAPDTPAAGNGVAYCDSADKKWKWKDDAGSVSVIGTGGGGAAILSFVSSYTTLAAASTSQLWVTSGGSDVQVGGAPWPLACTAQKLYVRVTSATPAAGTFVVTLYDETGAAATALTVSIPANSPAGVYSDTSHTVTMTAGSNYYIQVKNNDASNSYSGRVGVSFVCQ